MNIIDALMSPPGIILCIVVAIGLYIAERNSP